MRSGKMTIKRRAVKQLEYFKRKAEAKMWIEECLARDLGDLFELESTLCNGVILLELMARLSPFSVTSIQTPTDKFGAIYNSQKFIDLALGYGVKTVDFSACDIVNKKHDKLFECIRQLADISEKQGFPVKMSQINVDRVGREGTEAIKKIAGTDVEIQADNEISTSPEYVQVPVYIYREAEETCSIV